ncbi:MAG: WYL domain-containing protein [Peptococcaceae bacterium]|nr:WYL domain-containing protein [Peptococcaceae bacterium]
MNKSQRQKQLVKLIATSPWVYTVERLAGKLNASTQSIYRDLNELEANSYQFKKDEAGRIYLLEAGWDTLGLIKESTIRQVEILRFIAASKNGLRIRDIEKHFHLHNESSEKTIERDLKELGQKHLITCQNGVYTLLSNQLLPPVHLDATEKNLLIEALALQGELSPRKDEAKSILAKLQVSLETPSTQNETVILHGRRPVDNLRRNNYCLCLEKYAQSREKISILYRRGVEPALEISVNPLGLVYYWALDNWYLVAQDQNFLQIKTYLLDRILLIEPKGVTFSLPEGFHMKKWFKFSWGIFRTGEPVKVVIRFYPYYSTIQRVKEELKNRETCFFSEENGDLIVEDLVDGLDEIAVWLRGFGPGAEVIAPLELREKVQFELEKMLEIYGGH